MNDYIKAFINTSDTNKIQSILGIRIEQTSDWLTGYFYDQNLHAYWSINNIALFKEIIKKKHPQVNLFRYYYLFSKSLWCRARTPNSFYSLASQKNIFFYPTKNGIIKIDLEQKRVVKVIGPKGSEPDLINIETKAAKYFSKHVPKLYKAEVDGQLCILEHEHITNISPLSRTDWTQFIQTIIPDLVTFYQKSKITTHSSKEYLIALNNRIDLCLQNASYLKTELQSVRKIFVKTFSNVCPGESELYQTYVHGDLTHNNIIRTSDNWYLFDWSNGGKLNLLYDLMIQEYYLINTSWVWNQFNKISNQVLYEKEAFFGAYKTFEKSLKMAAKISLSPQQIKQNLLISLLELAIKSFRSYQHADQQTGKEMLLNTIQILKVVNTSK